MKTYLYPDGKTRDKALHELSPEEQRIAMIPKGFSGTEIRKREWEEQKAVIKAIVRIPYDLFLIGLTALVFLPDAIVQWWKESK